MAADRVEQIYAMRPHHRVQVNDPMRLLVLGIIRRAVLDAGGKDCQGQKHVASALTFLNSDDYRAMCDWLGARPSLAHQLREKTSEAYEASEI